MLPQVHLGCYSICLCHTWLDHVLVQAVCLLVSQVAKQAKCEHKAKAEASKHTLQSAAYWTGAIGRAHSSLTKSALQQWGKAQREANHGLVQKGKDRQARGKKQHQEGQIMSNYHGQLNMLKAYIQRTDLQHRCWLGLSAANTHAIPLLDNTGLFYACLGFCRPSTACCF